MSKFENANEASARTDEQRKAISEALGYEVEDEQIENAIETHKKKDTGTLVKELKWKEGAFSRSGGRDVELADEIDSLRIALSARQGIPRAVTVSQEGGSFTGLVDRNGE